MFSKFKTYYDKLNPEQRKAVDAIEGPVMVIAGPGTGKTQVLGLRIANILRKTDTPPDGILALTFTESGVYSMRGRLVEIIGADAYRVNIFTFHSFCNEVIRSYPDFFPRVVGGNTASEVEQIQILEEIIDNSNFDKIKPFGNPIFYIKPILSVIRELKRENIGVSDFKKSILDYEKRNRPETSSSLKRKSIEDEDSEHLRKNRELCEVYERYEKALHERSLYDYEDMILEVVRALGKNKKLLAELQEQYLYILADEHQDANRAQNRILELLLGFHKSPNIFIVGDEKQAIFRFQGASLENFLYFKEIYPDALILTLEKNYRSPQGILDASHSLIEKNSVNDPMLRRRLVSVSDPISNNPKIFLREFSKPIFEESFIAEDISKKIKSGIKPSSIGVFYRDNNDVFSIANALQKKGVPFEIYSGQRLFLDENIRKILSLLRAIDRFGDDELLAETLFIDFLNIDILDVFKVLEYCRRKKISLHDCLRSPKILEKINLEDQKNILSFYELLKDLSRKADNQNLMDFLENLIERSGYIKFALSNKNSWEELNKLEAFFGQARKLAQNHKDAKLSDFVSFLNLLKRYDVFLKVPDSYGPKKEAVNLMTAHSAKGLEFDYVYITGLFDGHWGHRKRRKNFNLPIDVFLEVGLEDERRLFYVALTRAKREIFLSFSREDQNQKLRLPSQFISEINPKLVKEIKTASLESEFLKKVVLKKPVKKPAENDIFKDEVFLANMFFDQGLSVSALNNYLECPWKYFFENLLRLPKAPNKNQMYGTAVHLAFEEFFKRYRNNEKPNSKDLIVFFENALRRQPLDKNDYEDALKKGRKSLSAYYDFYKNSWPKNIKTEFTINGVILGEVKIGGKKRELVLRGKLDKLEFIGVSDREVNVVDYKTSKPKSRNDILGKTKHSSGNLYRQLVFYKLLLNQFADGRYKMVSGEIDFIEPNQTGRFKKEKFFIGDNEVEDLVSLAKEKATEIATLSFWDKTCSDSHCKYCLLKKSVVSRR